MAEGTPLSSSRKGVVDFCEHPQHDELGLRLDKDLFVSLINKLLGDEPYNELLIDKLQELGWQDGGEWVWHGMGWAYMAGLYEINGGFHL